MYIDTTPASADPHASATRMRGKPKSQTPDLEQVLGQHIREARKAAKMTQQGLAAELKISFQQVQKYENGNNRIATTTMCRICKILGVSVADLLGPLCNPGQTDVTALMARNADLERKRAAAIAALS